MGTLFLLLILYQIKHLVIDYPLQGTYMLGKFKPGWDWVGPLLAHVALHAVGTYLIAIWFVGPLFALWLAVIDMLLHGAMDRIKASPNLLGRFKALMYEKPKVIAALDNWSPVVQQEARDKLFSDKMFWNSLGFDQMIHHLTHYLIIFLIMRYMSAV